MAIDLQERLDNIKVKSGMLVERYKHEREHRLKLEDTIRENISLIADLRQQIASLTAQNEMLKLNGLLNPTRQDALRSKAILSKLIRDIDRCIADLTE
ncbi:MAG: hypothetical protein J1E84_05655 [Muribaculaceae bacterium]|nr:hypothetical protein [Muribaculaceae bacterium]